MKLRLLGRTGLKVSVLALGATNFGSNWRGGRQVNERSAANLLDLAWDAGVNLLDTADIYGFGISEEMLGRLLAERRHRFFLATKVGGRSGPNDPAAGGLSARHIEASLDASLRRLRTDCVDLYMAHGPDSGVPIAETMEAFARAHRAGKVRVIGCSNFSGSQLRAALAVCGRGRPRFEFNQVQFSLACRAVESDVLPACAEAGVSILAWSPLARGALTGKHPRQSRRRLQATALSPEGLKYLLKVVRRIGEVEGLTPAQVAVGWVISKSFVASGVCGASTAAQLREILGARSLSRPGVSLLDRASASCLNAAAPHPGRMP